jgi:hypothetical protein
MRGFVLLKQSTEFQERRRVRRRLAMKVYADERTNRLTVVDRILNAFVRQVEALLSDIHAQKARQSDRRVASAFHLRIMWLDQFMQFRPRCHTVDLREEAVAPGQPLFGGVFEVGKALLQDQLDGGRRCRHCLSSCRRPEPASEELIITSLILIIGIFFET